MLTEFSDQHHESDSRNVKSRPALLQTFFRGNKIRYFEVSGGSIDGVPPTPDSDDLSHASTTSPHGAEVPGFLNSFSTVGPRYENKESNSRSPTSLPPQPVASLDMDALRLLHNYTVSTALNINRGYETQHFWTTIIPQEAFSHPFLMYGILGVSALHLAASPSTTDLRQVKELRRAGLHYQSLALPLYRAAMNNPSASVANALIAFARLICIQRCAMDLTEDKLALLRSTLDGDSLHSSFSTPSTPTRDEPSTLPIIEGLYLIKGLIDTLLALQPVLPPTSGFILPPDVRAGLEGKQLLGQSSSAPPDDIISHFLSKHGHFPLTLQAVLLPLPEAIARSIINSQSQFKSKSPSTTNLSEESQMSVITTAASILETSYSTSYASNPSPIEEIWNGVESGPVRFSKDFLDMVEAGHPTALLVVAFWTLLLRRQEVNYWFLEGQSGRLLRCVLANLEKGGEEWRIVEGLLDLEV